MWETQSAGVLMLAMVLLNATLGAICGVWFRVQVLIPVIALAFVEVAIFKQTGTWSSAFWLAILLIFTLDIGYLIGASVGTFWLSAGRERVLRYFKRHGGRVLHH